jgi:hypothetical protein
MSSRLVVCRYADTANFASLLTVDLASQPIKTLKDVNARNGAHPSPGPG